MSSTMDRVSTTPINNKTIKLSDDELRKLLNQVEIIAKGLKNDLKQWSPHDPNSPYQLETTFTNSHFERSISEDRSSVDSIFTTGERVSSTCSNEDKLTKKYISFDNMHYGLVDNADLDDWQESSHHSPKGVISVFDRSRTFNKEDPDEEHQDYDDLVGGVEIGCL